MLAAILSAGLTACGTGQIEIATMVPSAHVAETEQKKDMKTITVSTVDELLEALNFNAIIELEPGTYQLDSARNYGRNSDNPAYYWDTSGDSCQLTLNYLHDLTIRGSDRETTFMLTSSSFFQYSLSAGMQASYPGRIYRRTHRCRYPVQQRRYVF